MGDAGLLQLGREQLGDLDGGGAHQHRLVAGVALLDVADDGAELAGAVEEHRVRVVHANHRPVGGDDHHFQPVDALELGRLGVGGAGHARELVVHAEQVLEGDAGQGLVVALDGHAFLRLHRLVQAVGPAPALEGTAGELVDDDHLAVADDIVHVALVDGMRADGGVEVVDDVDVLRVVEAFVLIQDAGLAQQALGVLLAGLGQVDLLLLLVDPVIALAFFLFLAGQRGDDAVDLDVQVGRFLGRAGNNQWRARLVDEDRVDLVDDGVVEAALVAILLGQRHVVAQVVEAEFVVGAVGDVGVVRLGLGGVVHARVHHAHAQAEPVVQPAHPGRVAAGQVVVDGDHVHALAFQGVEVGGQGGDQGLALAGAHLGDLAHVQDHAADQLHVVVAHAQHPHAGLAADGKGLGQDLVERLAVGDALLEFGGLGLQLGVGQRLHLLLKAVDLVDDLLELFEQAFVAAAEDAGEQAIEHVWSGIRLGRPGARAPGPGNEKGRRAPFSRQLRIVPWG